MHYAKGKMRKSKEWQSTGDRESGDVSWLQTTAVCSLSRSHFAFKLRNYDPETKQMRKRGAEEGGEDTVEKAVEGLAESILREDEEKRKEELVCLARHTLLPVPEMPTTYRRTCSTSNPNEPTGT